MTISAARSIIVRHRTPVVGGLAMIGLVVVILAAGLIIGGSRGSGGRFSPTGSMASARSKQTATLLADGRVLVAGGQNFAAEIRPLLDSAELYDPNSGTFSATGPMTIARAGQTAILLADGRVLIIGGLGLSSAELYDPNSGTFSPTGPMTIARDHYTATLLSDGRVLVAGGDAGNGPLASAELYDPKTGAFSPTGSMGSARAFQTATLLLDGRVLIAGGADTSGGLASAELYDPKTGTFSTTGSMAEPREEHTATRLSDGRVLVAGGASFDRTDRPLGNGPLASAELYDPKTGTFSSTGSMVFAAEFYTATLLSDGRVLFVGGDIGRASLASAQVYDPKTGAFGSAGSMTVGREGHTATLLPDGRVLIAGGQAAGNSDSGASFASAELYQP
jgi:hypothetical protein